MLQRNLRWNRFCFVFVLALVFGLAVSPGVMAQPLSSGATVTTLLQSWWTGVWGMNLLGVKVTAPAPGAIDPTRINPERGSTLDPNGLRVTAPARAPRLEREPDGRTRD